jgi:hypothetical protein
VLTYSGDKIVRVPGVWWGSTDELRVHPLIVDAYHGETDDGSTRLPVILKPMATAWLANGAPSKPEWTALCVAPPDVGFKLIELQDIFADTIWTESRSVKKRMRVFDGSTLTVAAGVAIEYADGGGLDIRGAFVAAGTDAAPVTFISTDSIVRDDGKGRKQNENAFVVTETASITIDYATFEKFSVPPFYLKCCCAKQIRLRHIVYQNNAASLAVG